jgi:uncharacterized protein (DUF486 family)
MGAISPRATAATMSSSRSEGGATHRLYYNPGLRMQLDDRWKAALLLLASNAFMTVAWYGHLRFKKSPLIVAILASWGIALFEYMLQVPANRIGYGALSAFQLKILQEAITLVVFVIFAALWLGEGMQPRYFVSFALIFAAVFVAFR